MHHMATQEQAALRTLGKYKILGTLGRGSMGVVYKAQDPEIGRLVAIKVLRTLGPVPDRKTEIALERFKIEARSAGNLRHPNIITVFEVSSDGTTPYLVMDYLEGECLDRIIAKQGKLDGPFMIYLLSQVAAGLDYAHSKGVVHRDIKPSNILVDKAGTVFILDFGVARMGEPSSSSGEIVLGTPGYMSPEQILSKELDHRADLFSLAVVAFECLSGKRPFPGDNFTEVVGNILNAKPLMLSELVPGIPLSLQTEIERGLSKKKEERFDTAAGMIDMFGRCLGIDKAAQGAYRNESAGASRKRKLSSWRPFSMSGKDDKEGYSRPGSGPQNEENLPAVQQPRPRFDTTKDFSPWRFERRKVQAEQFGMSGPNKTVESPGGMFSHADTSLTGSYGSGSATGLRIMIGLMGLLSVLLSASIVWVIFSDTPEPKVEDPAVTVPVAAVKPPPPPAIIPPQVDAVPVGKAVEDMTDREILGVLVKGGVADDMLMRAIAEGKRRRVLDFVDAMVGLLQHDSYVVRIEAIKTMAEIGDKRVVSYLVLSLEDHDPLVRGHAARALGILGDRKALGFLQSRYIKEDVSDVKTAIKKSIEKINGFPFQG